MLDRYSKTPLHGTFYLTATHLIFFDPDAKKETWVCFEIKSKNAIIVIFVINCTSDFAYAYCKC